MIVVCLVALKLFRIGRGYFGLVPTAVQMDVPWAFEELDEHAGPQGTPLDP